jgi:hypothetical protein
VSHELKPGEKRQKDEGESHRLNLQEGQEPCGRARLEPGLIAPGRPHYRASMNDTKFGQFCADPVAYLAGKKFEIQTMAGEQGILRQENLRVGATTVKVKQFQALQRCKTMYLLDRVRNGTGEVYVAKDPEASSRQLLGYYLPWASDEAHVMQLDNLKGVDFFVTARLNGCCVFVNGGRNAPVVIHSNVQTDELATTQEKDESYAEYSLRTAKHKMKVWNKLYYSLGMRLIDAFYLDNDAPLSAFEPAIYQSKLGEMARVFGIKQGGEWSLYYIMDTLTPTRGGYTPGTKAGRLWPTLDQP